MKVAILAFALLTLASTSGAQPAQPYAGQQTRAVKSLADTEVADLLEGRGAGLAKAAELNGYPGPQHVLELAEPLALTPPQRAATAALIAPMRAAARQHGADFVARSRELDALFASGRATPEELRAKLDAAAVAYARVREAHLAAHIAQRALLTPEQIGAYQRLRGYAGSARDSGAPEQRHRH